MNLTERWHQIRESIRSRPLPWAIGFGVALAAIASGALMAAVISGGPRGTGQAASDEPTVSASASGSEEPSPSPTSTPEATPSPSPTPTPGAVPPSPTPTPEEGFGGAPAPSWDIEGTWTALPAMPDAYAYALSDVLVLRDGTLVVFRWQQDPGVDGAQVLRYDEDRAAWVAVATEPLLTGTDEPWAQAADGRIYTFETLIDPSTTPWSVDPFQLISISEPWAGQGLDAGSDGRIYLALPIPGAQLQIYDPVLDRRETTSKTNEAVGRCVLRALDHRVVAIDQIGFAFYDPTSDSWSDVVEAPGGDVDCFSAGYGPDERLYVTSFTFGGDIQAWDESTGAWSSVEPPPDPQEFFHPRFVTGPDGRLWAIEPHGSFAFTPDGD